MSRKTFAQLLLFQLIFLLYLRFLPPTITIDDSAQFSVSAFGLGLAQPTGYPLYNLLTKLFTLLPVGDIAFRVNVSGAFLESAAATLLLACFSFSFSLLTSFLLSSLYAFTFLVWINVQIAKVYPLHHLLFLLLLLLCLKWVRERDNRFLFLFAFLFGLGLTNHFTLILFAPLFLYLLTRLRKVFLLPLCLALLGLSVNLYLPLRAAAAPFLNWGDPSSVLSFSRTLTKWQWLKAFAFQFSFRGLLWKGGGILFYLSESLTPILLVCALAGAWKLWKTRQAQLLLLCTIAYLLFLFFCNAPKDQILRGDFLLYPLLLILLYCLGTFFESYPGLTEPLLGLSLLTVFLWQMPQTTQWQNTRGLNFAHALVEKLPRRAVLLTENVQASFYGWYVQAVEQRRRDLFIYPVDFVPLDWGRRQLEAKGIHLPNQLPRTSFFFHNSQQGRQFASLLAQANPDRTFYYNRDGGERIVMRRTFPWKMVFFQPPAQPKQKRVKRK